MIVIVATEIIFVVTIYDKIRSMRKTFIKLGVALAVFFLSMFIANMLMNRGNTDMTADMAPASLPIIYMNVNDEYINPLHGYTVEMEGNYLRGAITPLMANRSVSFKADLYDAVIAKVSYEVRPLDMSRLIEDTEVSNFTYEDNEIYATATLKDLIDDDTEYMLIIKLTTSSGNVIRYYTRVINRAELYIGEKVSFVRDFSAKTFNPDTALELKEYMESNAEGDNSSYGYVNIHSSFNQLTWGNLAPKLQTRKDLEIIDIDGDTASIKLSYQVEILNEMHNVSEFFRIQRGKKRMHLMEYERIMNQVFDEEKNVVVNGKILHGILDEGIVSAENEAGSIYAFVQQNELYSYDASTNTLSRLFAFADKDNNDERTRYDAHNIKPLDIDSVGNVRFIVYGYMNRGKHEGQVGVELYYYDKMLNTIEEELFIPYHKSYQILDKEVNSLSYISPRGRFYILLDGSVYNIDIATKEVNEMQNSISESSFFSSSDQNIIAWQIGESVKDYKEIQMYRLDTMMPSIVKADASDIVVPLGFMEDDLIYGCAHSVDITTDDVGRTLIPLYSINIQDESGNLLKSYSQTGLYILDIELHDNMIILHRYIRDDITGILNRTADDQIVDNRTESTMKNKMGSVVTESTETTYQTILAKVPDESTSLKVTDPKEVVYEGTRELNLENTDNITRFYVYAKGDLLSILTDASDCVNMAEDEYGVVVDKRMAYIWESANRKSSTRIEDLALDENSYTTTHTEDDETGTKTSDDDDEPQYSRAYADCLDIMLKSKGIFKDTQHELRTKSVMQVLRDNMNAQILELSGCDLNAVLYYVSRGYPVMAMTENRTAVLIVGYDSKNTILYNPDNGETYKMGMNDSAHWFEQNGNRFITFVD